MSPVVQQPLEVLEQSVFVLVNEAHDRVPVEDRRVQTHAEKDDTLLKGHAASFVQLHLTT